MLDREDLEVSVAMIEGAAPSKQSTKSPSTNNNNSNASPSSSANILADPKFARLL